MTDVEISKSRLKWKCLYEKIFVTYNTSRAFQIDCESRIRLAVIQNLTYSRVYYSQFALLIKSRCSSSRIFPYEQDRWFSRQTILFLPQKDIHHCVSRYRYSKSLLIRAISTADPYITGRDRLDEYFGNIYLATLWMRETATYLPSAVKAAAFGDRGKMDRLGCNSDADIRTYDKSHGAEENGMEVFWHPLKFIADYAEYLACAISARPPPGISLLSILFSTSPGGSLFHPFPPRVRPPRKFHFLAKNSANLWIASPAICRANKYRRDNILIDLWYNPLFPVRGRENRVF